jgi:NYN domain
MNESSNNYAFVDSQNLNLSIRALGWKLNFSRFRVYLKEKYGVSKAFLFIGYVEGNSDLYVALQEAGFICIFKPTLKYKDGTTKGNCDAELVLQAMIEYQNYEKAVIVTGDGDFHCLVHHLIQNDKLKAVIIPNKLSFSALYKMDYIKPFLRYMNDLQEKLEYKKKRPHKDETL